MEITEKDIGKEFRVINVCKSINNNPTEFNDPCMDQYLNRIGILNKIPKNRNKDNTLHIKFSDHNNWFCDWRLERVENETKFKKGDKVKIIKIPVNCSEKDLNCIGVITKIQGKISPFHVSISEGNCSYNNIWCNERDLELIPEKSDRLFTREKLEKIMVKPEYSPGDKITVIKKEKYN